MAAATYANLLLTGVGLAIVVSIVTVGFTAYPMQMLPIAVVFWVGVARYLWKSVEDLPAEEKCHPVLPLYTDLQENGNISGSSGRT